jgi:spore coat polysaccharide biosynthesis predicted glycosyltransferase SpsG
LKRKIYFRADASGGIGYGHFIRTLALADMLKNDFSCTFFTVHPTEYQLGELRKVCKCVALKEETKFEDFLSMLLGDEIVVLDNYFYTTDYQTQIREKGCKLGCIDDPHSIQYDCDVLISHGFVFPNDFDASSTTIIKTGVEWALLRNPFLKKTSRNGNRENTIVVNFGGSDPYNVTERIVSQLLGLQLPYKIRVILGDRVYLSENCRKGVEILHNLSAEQMADLFDNSSIGFFSASTVCIEGLSRGLPMIVGYYIDNQEKGYQRMAEQKVISPIGDLRQSTPADIITAKNYLSQMNDIDIHPELIKNKYIKLFSEL